MMIKEYECGWIVDKPLTKEEADDVFKSIAGEIEFWADGSKGRNYYKKGTCIEETHIKNGKITLLIISAKVDRKRQILFYRDQGNGTFYLEGDVQADSSNQIFFLKGLSKLCSIWGNNFDDFFNCDNVHPEEQEPVGGK